MTKYILCIPHDDIPDYASHRINDGDIEEVWVRTDDGQALRLMPAHSHTSSSYRKPGDLYSYAQDHTIIKELSGYDEIKKILK